jgi:mxaJ protein
MSGGVFILAAWLAASMPPGQPLRVCADPNNLPFSNSNGQGFENEIAALLAHDLGRPLRYTWWAERRGFLRNTLGAGRCDLVMAVPASSDRVRTTRPYYRSSYVFVSRRARGLTVRSFDDPVLRTVKIGIPLVGDDGANPPPAHALGRRGIVDNVVGFTVYGDYREDSPPQRILEALVRGEVDVAVVWGPLAGAFARRVAVPLRIEPVTPSSDGGLPLTFAIALGVREDDEELQRQLDLALSRRRADIEKILEDHGVPRAR